MGEGFPRGYPLVLVDVQHLVDQVLGLWRDMGPVALVEFILAVFVLEEDAVLVAPLEKWSTGEHHVEYDTRAEDV